MCYVLPVCSSISKSPFPYHVHMPQRNSSYSIYQWTSSLFDLYWNFSMQGTSRGQRAKGKEIGHLFYCFHSCWFVTGLLHLSTEDHRPLQTSIAYRLLFFVLSGLEWYWHLKFIILELLYSHYPFLKPNSHYCKLWKLIKFSSSCLLWLFHLFLLCPNNSTYLLLMTIIGFMASKMLGR